MKIWAIVAIAALEGLSAWAGENHPGLERMVTVCMDDVPEAYAARMIASKMFERIGVKIEWQHNTAACRSVSGSIQIRLQQCSTDIRPSEALGYAKPIEGTHIVVFYDRVRQLVASNKVPSLLAHVLTHEITHILQGCSQHSNAGVMKAQWDSVDYSHMLPNPLGFTPIDIHLIEQGMNWRDARNRAGNSTSSLDSVP